MQRCDYADKYKAIHPPRCNGGDPCDACRSLWIAMRTMRHEDETLAPTMPSDDDMVSLEYATNK